jgi:hypothetical protein
VANCGHHDQQERVLLVALLFDPIQGRLNHDAVFIAPKYGMIEALVGKRVSVEHFVEVFLLNQSGVVPEGQMSRRYISRAVPLAR